MIEVAEAFRFTVIDEPLRLEIERILGMWIGAPRAMTTSFTSSEMVKDDLCHQIQT